jgi:hypothetical protein
MVPLFFSLGIVLAASATQAELITVDTKFKPADAAWVPRETQILDQLTGYSQKTDPEYGRYGGLLKTRFKATGYFHADTIDGRWWLIDPEGHLFIHKAIVSVQPMRSAGFIDAFNQKFKGSSAVWADSTTRLLWNLSFNGSGAWSADRELSASPRPVVYCPMYGIMSTFGSKHGAVMGNGNFTYPDGVTFVFHPDLPTFVDSFLNQQVSQLKNDPYLLGYFSDNEMPWPQDALNRLLSIGDSRKAERDTAWQWLRTRKGRTDVTVNDVTNADREAFLQHMSATYFGTIKAALDRYDPNHLFLGARINGGYIRSEAVIRGAGEHVDVMSFNWYNQWTPDQALMANWLTWANRPFLITEWYAKGADTSPYLTNESGAGWLVRTQQDRGYFYQNFAIGLLKSPGCVGWHWFKYADNDPLDLTTDVSNRNANKGIVNNQYQLYTPLTDQMIQLNKQVFSLIEFLRGRSTPEGYPDSTAIRPENGRPLSIRMQSVASVKGLWIELTLSQPVSVAMQLYDLSGKLVGSIPEFSAPAGSNRFRFTTAGALVPGVYVLRGAIDHQGFQSTISIMR